MRLFDTHCHFESAAPNLIAAQLERAKAAGVERLLAVGGSPALNLSVSVAADLTGTTLPRVSRAVGFDRDQIGSSFSASDDFALLDGATALGEVGLDYHYSPKTRTEQLTLFAEQLEEARRRDLPVVIHSREADDDTLALLRETPSRGVIHCYTGTVAAARQYLDLGFYISLSGIVTFRPAENVREVARMLPDDRMLIETDSPFLAPEPLRGQPNEPANVRHTCAFLAKLRGLDPEALAELTFANAERLFGT